MPVYNEARTLRTIVERVLKSPIDLDIELICVDDCSSDASLEIIRELAQEEDRIKVIALQINGGKGQSDPNSDRAYDWGRADHPGCRP